jgi:hypothetical protein
MSTAPRYSIVGEKFHPGAAELLKTMTGGEELLLVREPDNKYDKNAIAVYFGGRKIGYIPKANNITLSKFIDDNGAPVSTLLAQDGAVVSEWKAIKAVFARSANSAFPQAEIRP